MRILLELPGDGAWKLWLLWLCMLIIVVIMMIIIIIWLLTRHINKLELNSIIIIITFIRCIYNYVPETNYVSRVYYVW